MIPLEDQQTAGDIAVGHARQGNARHGPERGDQTLGSNRFCHRLLAIQLRFMGTDLTAILISSVFLGVGSVVAKFFPEASLMAGVFLVGLALVNITLHFVS